MSDELARLLAARDCFLPYGMEGKQISWDEFIKLDRIVLREIIPDFVAKTDIVVSTVLLGIDASIGRAAAPIIFETMVYDGGKTENAELCQLQYTSLKEAKIGHVLMVKLAKEGAFRR